MKKILITNHFLKDYTGSEIATLDIAKEFLAREYNVTVGSFTLADPLKLEFDKLNIRFLDLNCALTEHFDIIWAHHFTTLDTCLIDVGITADKIIFSSLSPYEPLESLPLSIDKVSLFLANSMETKNILVEMGIYSEAIMLFPNPVSHEFFIATEQKEYSLRKIAIVSNHIPSEIKEIINLLALEKIEIKIFGVEGEFKLITAQLLQKFDAVITIGRTVQYCLALGIPVYCYDRFGGPGWITESNINLASQFNFSGRCVNTVMLSDEIAQDIINNFPTSSMLREFYRNYAKTNYNLSTLTSKIMKNLEQVNSKLTYHKDIIFKNISFRQRKEWNKNKNIQFFIQCFIDKGNGFSEENSIKLPVAQNAEFQEFTFDLTDKQTIKTLRLDPLSECCVIEIESLYVRKNATVIDLLPYVHSNAEIHHGKSLFFTTNDPQMYFSGLDESTFEDAQLLVVVLRYMHIAKDALHVCVKQKNQELLDKEHNIQSLNQELLDKEHNIQSLNQELLDKEHNIQSLNQELLDMYTSKSWKITRPLRHFKCIIKG